MSDFRHQLHDHVAAQTPDTAPPFAEVLARRRRRRTRRRTTTAGVLVVSVALAVYVAGQEPGDGPAQVAVDPTSSPSSPGSPTESPESFVPDDYQAPPGNGSGPPPVQLLLESGTIDVRPFTACYPSHCYEGVPEEDPDSVGSPGFVEFGFAGPRWSFEATFDDGAEPCPRQITVPVERTGPETFRLPPAGNPGAQAVTLFGVGPNDAYVFATFGWTTPVRGTMPTPDAKAALVRGAKGGLQVDPLELTITDLAATPRRASAEVTVVAANGRSTTVTPTRVDRTECVAAGSVGFAGTQAESTRVLELGPAPYTYQVRLTLDGATFTGTGQWPQDERPAERPYVDLAFTPPLPAFTG